MITQIMVVFVMEYCAAVKNDVGLTLHTVKWNRLLKACVVWSHQIDKLIYIWMCKEFFVCTHVTVGDT